MVPDASRPPDKEDRPGAGRYVLCRPQGGFNDQLSQIELCCRYAERTGRIVIVDTGFRNASTFHDDFSRYFIARQPNLILSPEAAGIDLDALATVPASIKGRVSRYSPTLDRRIWRFVDEITREPITFDMRRDYPEALLVHHQAGRTEDAVHALERLTITPAIADELFARLKQVDGPYVGVHIRHTDYRSRYRPGLRRLKDSPAAHVFVATDNQAVLDEFIAELGAARVVSFSRAISTDGGPIHHQRLSGDSAYARNRDTILDLLMLALASDLITFELEPNQFGVRLSGFSALARELRSAKPILKSLIGRDDLPLRPD